MSEPLRETEIEGTWEEVMSHAEELRGRHVKLAIMDGNDEKRTAVAPPVSFKGKPITDFDAYLASLPQIANDADFAAFEQAIAEERAQRRQRAGETPD